MAKIHTPAMEKFNNKKSKKTESVGPWKEAAKRLKRNKSAIFGLIIVAILIVCAIIPSVIAPYGPDEQDYGSTFLRPSKEYLMGTDSFGRDIFSRVIYGARVSMLIGFVSVGMAIVVGGTLGAVAAFYGGILDNIIMRFIDVLLAIPSILLAISIAAALGPGLFNLMIAISLGSVPTYARVVRASLLTVKGEEYVEAAKSIGANNIRLVLRHMIPNALAPIIVQATLGVAGAILSAAGLSFIGLGIRPPTPEWGSMLSGGRQYIRNHWHIVTFPGLTIMITIFALNLLGDGLRDALDPRLKR